MVQNLEDKEVLLRFIFLLEEATGDSVSRRELWELVCTIHRNGFLGLGPFGRFSTPMMDEWFIEVLDDLKTGGCVNDGDHGRLALTQIGVIAAKGIALPEPLMRYERQIVA